LLQLAPDEHSRSIHLDEGWVVVQLDHFLMLLSDGPNFQGQLLLGEPDAQDIELSKPGNRPHLQRQKLKINFAQCFKN
jgi:hypothetical protein